MPGPQAGQPGAMNIDQLQNTAINVVENFCSVIAMPVEIILRPWYGTRYFPVPVIFFCSLLMILLPAFTAAATGITHMIPFSRFAPPRGLFDIGSLARLYFLVSLIHGFRLYRRMVHMELEIHSEFEGPPLPFFRLIPGSGSFWFTRIVIEPAFVFIAAMLLEQISIIQSGLATYLQVAALSLAMKSFVAWFKAWQFLRDALDMRNAGPIIAKLLDNTATQAELSQIHLASFPKDLSPDTRREAAAHIARVYSPATVIPEPFKGESNVY